MTAHAHHGAMNAYDRIARVIRHVDATRDRQPDLAQLAAVAGLSPTHFHRLFSQWVGVTPKDFVQCLTHAHARAGLQRGASVLAAALDAGLSGSGRLHDLCVALDAATPGECRRGGAGLALTWGYASSPFGDVLIAVSPRGLMHLRFADDVAAAEADLRAEWPHADFTRDDGVAHAWAARVFAARPTDPHAPLRAYVRGTAFQVKVWRALLDIPPGALMSYGALAARIGAPQAARAVGTAVGRNPLAWLIPCHRVIRETGIVGDYRWGTARKRAMIAWESARSSGARSEDL